jgi:hypothetical protein
MTASWRGDMAIARAYDKTAHKGRRRLSVEDTVSCRHRLFIPAKQAPIGIYNLNGVRQAKPQMGINIIDWNKVLVK